MLLCNVDLTTGKSIVLAQQVKDVKVDDGDIYYRQYDEDGIGHLYRIAAGTDKPVRLHLRQAYSGHDGAFAALNGRLYYQDNSPRTPHTHYVGQPDEEAQKALEASLHEQRKTTAGSYELFRLDGEERLNPGGRVEDIQSDGNYLWCRFYTVYNKNDDAIYK